MAIQAPWTSTMMKTWQTSIMRNPSIPSLAYHPHAFGHLLPSYAIFQFIHLSSILQLLSHTIHLPSAASANYPNYHLSPLLLSPSFKSYHIHHKTSFCMSSSDWGHYIPWISCLVHPPLSLASSSRLPSCKPNVIPH